MKRYVNGFSLLELMVALVISSILAVIAFPVYTGYQAHVSRQKAQVVLMQIATYMAAYFTQHDTYEGARLTDAIQNSFVQQLSYTFAIAQSSDVHFLLTASPSALQIKHDIACGVLTLTDENVRGVTGDQAVHNCW